MSSSPPPIQRWRLQSAGVYVSQSSAATVGPRDLAFFEQDLPGSPLGRVRGCTHAHAQERQQEMFIAFSGSGYVRASYHAAKEESLLVLSGSGRYLFFDANGVVTKAVTLGSYQSNHDFYCRIQAHLIHQLVVTSHCLVAQETTLGPFQRSDTFFPDWAPEVQDAGANEAAANPVEETGAVLSAGLSNCRPVGAGSWLAENTLSISRVDLEMFAKQVLGGGPSFARLFLHEPSRSALRESFLILQKGAYLRPLRDPACARSVHVLDGRADLVFFDPSGTVLHKQVLEAGSTENPFYARIPADVYHTLIPSSDLVKVHEVSVHAEGACAPRLASWAPPEDEPIAGLAFCGAPGFLA